MNTDMDFMKPSSPGLKDKKILLPYICNVCSKAFSRKDVLKTHMMFHSKKRPFPCHVCEKSFVQKSDLLRHIAIHSKIPIHHKCEQCLEVFQRKLDLLRHIKDSHRKPSTVHTCNVCKETFSRKIDLLHHMKILHAKPIVKHECEQCNATFSKKIDFLRHRKIHSKPEAKHTCKNCMEEFKRKTDLINHMRASHPAIPKKSTQNIFSDKVKHLKRRNALNIFSKTMFESSEENERDFFKFFDSIRLDMSNELNFQLIEKRTIKWYATIRVILTRTSQDGDLEEIMPYFNSKTVIELTTDNLTQHIENAFTKIMKSFEQFTQQGSGWTLDKILYLELSAAKYGIA